MALDLIIQMRNLIFVVDVTFVVEDEKLEYDCRVVGK